MELSKIIECYGKFKKGAWALFEYKTEKTVDGVLCEKRTTATMAIRQYGHIAGVEVKGKPNPNDEVIIEGFLYHNVKTDNYLVQLATNNLIKSHSTYYLNGKEVTREEYEAVSKPRKYNGERPAVIRIKAQNLISIKQGDTVAF